MERALISLFCSTLPLATLSCLIPLTAQAQVTPDGTTNTTVNVNGNNFTIEQGDRAGGNLFHSFQEFSVPNGGEAFFNNAVEVNNIFSRVTGGNLSNIDGLIRANGNANLFLINPAGILFGEGARLDIGGSFYGSTADSIVFPDGEFSAIDPDNRPILTINAPIGLSFRDNPGDIVNRSRVENSAGDIVGLEVLAENNFTLVGGNINLLGGIITAPGGRIDLGGLSAAGIISINADETLSFPDDIAKADVTLTNQAEVNVRAGGGGFINVNARNITLSDESKLLAGIADSVGSPNAQAGGITINTDNLNLTNGALVEVNTSGQRNASSVNITASDTITIEGQKTIDGQDILTKIVSQVREESVGDAGRVTITTSNLNLSNGGEVNTNLSGQGNVGSITITASDTINIDGSNIDGSNLFAGVVSQVFEEGEGNAGDVVITTGNLNIKNGGQVAGNTSSGQGNVGSVNITASDTITIDGQNQFTGVVSQLFEDAVGDAGGVTITTDNLNLSNGGEVVSQVKKGAVGNAGGVTIATGNLNLSNGGKVAANLFGQGNAGDININNTNSIVLNNKGEINSSVGNGAQGNAGNININNTNSIFLQNQGEINSRVGNGAQGNAGNININVLEDISLQNNSKIETQVLSNGVGNAGNINIDVSGDISLENISKFATQMLSDNVGNSGNINIHSKSFTSRDSDILADIKGIGNAGDITIKATDSVVLDSSRANPTVIISQLQQNSVGEAGDITISASQISLNNFALISTNIKQDSEGKAGNITINADTISLNNGSVIDALTETNFDGGDININANLLELSNGGKIVTAAERDGNAGDIALNITGNIILNNANPPENTPFDETFLQEIQSETGIFANNSPNSTGNGGNINLKVNETIFLRNNSRVSAEAGNIGNGGNIIIDAEFIIASPSEPPEDGNDIVASAKRGNGGIIIFSSILELVGIQERLAIEGNGTNDIDASSEFGSPGKVSISEILIELPEDDVTDASDQVAQNPCKQGIGSEFIITGKGGLPPNPHEILSSDRVQVALVEPVQGDWETGRLGDWEMGSSETLTPEIVPAQGLIVTDTGEVILTSYVPSAIAEGNPPNPLVQTPTNPNKLATQAAKLYQNQEFDEAATLWSQAAQAFAASGDNLNQAMAWSNLALTYQQLGRWEKVNQAIQNSLISLNAAPENSRLVAQTLDIQGKLQRETGQAAEAIDTWQKAANIYQQLDESTALTQNKLNQAQAFLDLGLYTRACQTILASLKMENIASCQDLERLTTEELEQELNKIIAQPSLHKVLGLRKLGNLLLVIGEPQKSLDILKASLTLAEKLNSPSEIAATHLSIGKNYHSFTTKEAEPIRRKREGNIEKALEAYRQAIASSPDLITQQQAKINQFSLLLQIEQWSEAASLGQEILTQINNLPPGRRSVFAQINFAHILIELLDPDQPQPSAERQLPSNSEIKIILTTVTENALTLGDKNSEAYAWGNRGRLYELKAKLSTAEQNKQQAVKQYTQAEQYTQKSISLISTLDSPDIAYQYLWQLGRIQNRQGKLAKAISAYTTAYNALQSLRKDIATINPEVQFSFRDQVEPVYRELVALDFKYAQTLGNKANTKDKQEEITAKLTQARDVMESLQLAQLQNFFREACIVANPQQIDKIDPNAAVIYTIVLPDKLGILFSLPNQPPKLYSVDVTQEDISEAVETMRKSLETSDIPVAETLPEYQKVYNWLIRPLEAELEKNKEVKTLAFVLDEDLRNIPMAVLHDGQQYLIEKKYALALTSGLQLLDPKPLTAIELNVTAAGLSKNQDGSDLSPEVATELQAIEEIGLTDKYLLNEEFTKEALKQNIVNSRSSIIHLATLAQFRPKAEDTYILAWDEQKMNINEFADLLRVSTFKRQKAIELLVLDASETGRSDPETGKEDEQASLGLAGVAIQAGVRSTLATLWSAENRTSTTEIMKRFYHELQQANTTKANKAEALRQAQLNLIKDTQFKHPHYWAPFILIGNWQ
ncbi:MAG: CHAT domain-containing protein [Xenococcus sp. (in: cyanobacteria)]